MDRSELQIRRCSLLDRMFISERGLTLHCRGLTIGDNCHISRNVTIYTAQHRYESTALPYDDAYLYSPVTIGKIVWIGMNVSILPGVRIGDGAIVGMGAIVSRNVGDREIVGNPPFRVLKNRELQRYEKLERRAPTGELMVDP